MQKLNETHLTPKYLKFPLPPYLNLESRSGQLGAVGRGTGAALCPPGPTIAISPRGSI